MTTKTLTHCDLCGGEIESGLPHKIMIEPSHGPEIGSAHDTKDACDGCMGKIYETFPVLKDAERLVRPVQVPPPQVVAPPEMDTWTPEQVLLYLGKKIGVNVVRKPDEG